MIQFLFFFLAFLAIGSALMVILSRDPIYSILFLILVFFALTGAYILLNAQFVGIVNIIVYGGAIMVLFLHTVMLVNWNRQSDPLKKNYLMWAGMLAGGVLLVVLVGALKAWTLSDPLVLKNEELGLVKNLGRVLFKDFLLPFEVASILFLTAMVGAVLLAKKETN